MDERKLSQLLDSDEGTTLEFKKSLEFPDTIARVICAFANTFGGYLIIGVEKQKDKTIIAGVQNPDSAFQKLGGIVSQLRPKPFYQVSQLVHEGKTILSIRVDALPISEVCFLGKSVFRRVGSISEEIAGSDLVHFLQQRGTVSFEENRSLAKMEDLNEQKIRSLLKKRNIDLKKHEPLSMKSLLSSLGVANILGDFYLKNVAILFFAKDVQKFFLNPEIRIVKFRGKTKSLEAREFDQRFANTLPELLEIVFHTIKEKSGTFGRIVEGKRVSEPMIPDEVLREALTNAVGHRDYFDPNGILIEIYDDRMVIENPGSLLPGQSIKNFIEIRKHRNPIVYRLLNDSKWGEGLNLGIRAMFRIMRENKLPEPLFEDLKSIFRITLFGPLSMRKMRTFDAASERQEIVIEYLKTNKTITAPKYAKIAGISHPTAITDLNLLVKKGMLRKTGLGRSTRYELELKY
jgi:ATP-dependent DNA helicase RecG